MRRLLAVGLTIVAAPAAAQDPEPDGPDIVVTAGKPLNLDAKVLRAAQRRFAEDRAELAPQGVLRFELWRGKRRVPATDIGLALTDRAGRTVPVTVDGDGRVAFATIPDGKWFLTAPAQSQGMRLRPIVLSSGTGIDDRRLGDLRMQCRVAVSMGKAQASLLALPLIGMFDAVGGCASKRFGFYHIAERPLASAVVVERAGGDARPLRLSATRDAYLPPLSDRTVGNEARVRTTYQ